MISQLIRASPQAPSFHTAVQLLVVAVKESKKNSEDLVDVRGALASKTEDEEDDEKDKIFADY